MEDNDKNCMVDFDASLLALSSAYKRLQAENAQLREELAKARVFSRAPRAATPDTLPLELDIAPTRNASKGVMASETSLTRSVGVTKYTSNPMMESVFKADDRFLMDKKRNASCADLQQLIADLDPEEQGAWASRELRLEDCVSAMHGKEEDKLREILQRMKAHLMQLNPPVETPTTLSLLNETCTEAMQDIFGEDLLPLVIELQDALSVRLTNELVAQAQVLPQHHRALAEYHTKDLASGHIFYHIAEDVRGMSKFDIVESVGAFFVALNTIMLGVSTDWDHRWVGWDYISAAFAMIFIVELVTKIVLAGGVRAYYTHNVLWRVFDTGIIALACLDIALLLILADADSVDARFVTLVRIMRLIRLSRISRLGRTTLFHELAYMIRGIEAGTSTLVWALVLLIIVCYVGAVLLSQTIGRGQSAHFRPYAEKHFHSVTLSMFTLFRCFTGDCSAFNGLPLSYVLYEEFGRISIAIYWSSIMVVTFGLFNVMIANFLQNSQRAAKFNDGERRRLLRRERKMVREKTATLLKRVQELYSHMQPRISMGEMQITRELFRQMLKDRELAQWLDDMGCDDGLRERLFDKIDKDANGVLSVNELVSGVVDLLRGRFDNMESVTMMLRSINTRLVEMEGALAVRQNTNNVMF